MASINNRVFVLQNGVYPADFLLSGPRVGSAVRILQVDGEELREISGIFSRFHANEYGQIQIDIEHDVVNEDSLSVVTETVRAPLSIQRLAIAAQANMSEIEYKEEAK